MTQRHHLQPKGRKLVDIVLAPYLAPHVSSYPEGKVFQHTASCDKNLQCQDALKVLSIANDRSESCVFGKHDQRISDADRNAMYEKAGVPFDGKVSEALKAKKRAEYDNMRQWMHDNRHTLFPSNATSRSAVHGRHCQQEPPQAEPVDA